MPNFVAKPPVLEARPFNGGPDSTLEIQGWLLAHEIQSQHNAASGVEGNANYVPEEIVFGGTNRLKSGQFLMWMGSEFKILTASQLYTNYTQV